MHTQESSFPWHTQECKLGNEDLKNGLYIYMLSVVLRLALLSKCFYALKIMNYMLVNS